MHVIERALNLHPGDLKRVLPLSGYLFLIMTAYVIGKNARDALFLENFKVDKLPFADIAIAISVGFVVMGYVRLARLLPMRTLLAACQLFFASNALALWALSSFTGWRWIYPVLYVWVGIIGVLAPAQAWTLANSVLTTRDAKRLFAIVAAGAIMGGLVAGAAGQLITRTSLGTRGALIGIAVLIAASVFVLGLIPAQTASVSAGIGHGHAPKKTDTAPLLESLRMIWSSRYLRVIAIVICISSLVSMVANVQFKAFVKAAFSETDAYMNFTSAVSVYMSLACLAAHLLLTSRVLRRFGIGPALLVVPVALLLTSGGVLIWGTLAAAVLLRGSDQVFRYSIDKSTVELLYLPVPAAIKVPAKSFIDTIIWRVGDGLGGLLLAVLLTWMKWPVRRVSAVVIALLCGWLAAAVIARREYIVALRESIREQRLDTQFITVPVLDRSTSAVIATHLSKVQGKDILYALTLFELGQEPASHPALRVLLRHPDPRVRARVIAIFSAAGEKSVQPQIENLLRDRNLEVRTAALLYLARHAHVDPLEKTQELGDFPDFSARAALVAFFVEDGSTQNLTSAHAVLDRMVHDESPDTRAEAARLIAGLPAEFWHHLDPLLHDVPAVAREAIRTAGKLQDLPFVPSLVDWLISPEARADAADALARFGDGIVGTLRDRLVDRRAALALRREIPAVLARIGTMAAGHAVAEVLLDADPALRLEAISALNKLGEQPGMTFDVELVETLLIAEAMGHYASHQFLYRLGPDLADAHPAEHALRQSMRGDEERIFRLLKLLSPQHDFRSAFNALHSPQAAVRDNAIEFLDNVLHPSLRKLLVPLFDPAVGVAAREQLANELSGAVLRDRDEILRAMLTSADPWLKRSALHAIEKLYVTSLAPQVEECRHHPDAEVREGAERAHRALEAFAAQLSS